MKRSWIGLALLSASWLFGLSYYHDAQWLVWGILIAVGTGLFIGIHIHTLTTTEAGIAAVLLLPAIDLAPWPYRLAPLLIFVGLIICILPIPRRWPGIFASALIFAGLILLAQSLGILGYEYITAKSHELPWPFPGMLYRICKLLGFKAALDGTNLGLYSPRAVHFFGATWELLLDPVTLSFLTGGIAMLCMLIPKTASKGKRELLPKRHLAFFVILIAAWAFIRATMMLSIFMHRALRTEYNSEMDLMEQFWNPWIYLVFIVGPVLLSLRFIRIPNNVKKRALLWEPSPKPTKHIGAIILTIMGSFMLVLGLVLDMPGKRKAGRIMVDEYHSTWEGTERPFDTEWYGNESGYNYACIYDYCSRFYDMSRLNTPIENATLENCDVLIVKVPTSPYAPEEITKIIQFVEQGGGLMLVGEHTTVFNTGTHLNDIAKKFGSTFRYDCLFDIDTTFEQLYNLPLVPHPIIQNMPPMYFAVSCSISPESSSGQAVIRSTGLKNLLADYHASNFYPQVENKAEMRYGAFVQLWTTRKGAGRVLAFSDSTIFSNFSTFEEGKAELMLGMLEWLNHRNYSFKLNPFLILGGILIIAYGLVLCRRWNVAWLLVLSAGIFGWSTAVVSARAIHQYSMPLPKANKPMVQIVIDRTVCDAPLSRSGFIAGKRDGFGIFERWILRLGYFTSRKKGTDAFTGDLVVFMHPNLRVESDFREGLVDYVAAGGKVLILDSPENTQSTANSLLYPFGLTVNRTSRINGQLKAPESWPTIRIDSAFKVEGGEPLMWASNQPIAATVHYGEGTVTVIGFGSRFVDAYMGVIGDVIPNEQLRKVFDLQFTLFRSIISEP